MTQETFKQATSLATTQLYHIEPGHPHPLGATPDANGVNFSLFADRATAVTLLLFAHGTDREPILAVPLDLIRNRTFPFWHVYIRGLRAGCYYAYRVDGPTDLHGYGDRYNPNKVLLDPYAKSTTKVLWNRADAIGPGDNVATSIRGVVLDPGGYDWQGDRPLKHLLTDTIIYELHVRGFTQSPTSGCRHPGTYAGIIEKIPYLKELGITAVELLPVFDFDEKEVMRTSPLDGTPLTNYWGYDPINFFSPHSAYALNPEDGSHLNEFRDMIRELHKAGIEVILDVVFNHTGERGEQGPIISFKGLANSTYYLLSPQDKQYYMNYSGAGNTINGNHPMTEKLIIDALEYWVKEMHVDGFRFDEAVILCRNENGDPAIYPPVVWHIELSEVLADTKVIAEAWDAAGLYQLGRFPGYRWGEWNGRYRDAIRRFVRGDQGHIEGQTIVGRVATVIAGSADIFQDENELPTNSINFITAHDGFTLNDLVSYNQKHNEANGWNNQDGIDDNLSWNCGMEGETNDPAIEALRRRQVKNFAAILFLSQGVPMFVAGDEVRRTQRGNNNAYNQNNEISWFDWTLVEKNQEIFRFFKKMIEFRKLYHTLRRSYYFTGQVNARGLPDISWHGTRLNSPDWFDPSLRALAFTLGGFPDDNGAGDTDIHVILNMDERDLDFDLPSVDGRSWYRVIDTSQPSPHDIAENLITPGEERRVSETICHAGSHSVVVFISR
ncbi:MAG: glycogen debranching protein GlgX [Ktedonobacteraceae bacterium]|nr:glycogen debranching protein GlgX [Ktedonobacteraceae bacterium]